MDGAEPEKFPVEDWEEKEIEKLRRKLFLDSDSEDE
jgi:hypothetical protein